jgi:hypothetical protein
MAVVELGMPYLGKGATNIPVSNSEIGVFKECKRKWFLQYYVGLRLKKITVVGPLPLGTRVHNALEAYYKEGEDAVETYMELLKTDRTLFEASDDAMFEDKVSAFNDEAELGRLMVEGYVQWLEETNADSDMEVLAVEAKASMSVMDGRIVLQGKLDMKVRNLIDGSVSVWDHKTAQTFTSYHQTSHMSEQLMLYVLLEKLNPETVAPVDGGVYNLLKKVKRSPRAKPPFYERITVRFNDKTLSNFWTRIHGELRDMIRVRDELDAGADHRLVAYPSPSRDCTWKCPFFSACTMFDDGSNIQGWLDNFTEVGNPYARYDNEDEGTNL